MGSKKPILKFVTSNIEDVNRQGGLVCDLFSGSCTISAALRRKMNFISNDIQSYSEILGRTYFSNLSEYEADNLLVEIESLANEHLEYFRDNFGEYFYEYQLIDTLKEYQKIELKQRNLHNFDDFDGEYYLFVKYYSGTYWSFEQCAWIDSLRRVADNYRDEKVFYAILSSLMYAMSYTTQSTGHFAQYRDGNSLDAMKNIITYRVKDIFELFSKKLKELINTLDNSVRDIQTTTLTFQKCLELVPEGSTVYADPPYAPVHYSRFYHVLETLVKYDYPSLKFKGRYREDRHQSPFSQKTKALQAFNELFSGIVRAKSQMVLSYSGSGVVNINSISQLADAIFPDTMYILETKELEHKHSTMGRFEDQNRDVIEYLIIAKFK